MAGGIILKVTYGYKTMENNDPYVGYAEEVLQDISLVFEPGAWLVDMMPWSAFIFLSQP
jgi:hypothetical protein